MRQYSPWLVFSISAIIVLVTVGLSLFGSAFADASLAGPLPAGMAGTPASEGAQACGACHPAEFENWVHSTHADATFDPIFQVYMQTVRQPGECFACHTTGYSTTTGQFLLAGVTCEACHGPYRPEHPTQSMTIARSAEMCGTCHISTIDEWKASRHGQVEVACIDCHEVHSQRTRATATTDALCAGCHEEQVKENTVHQRHPPGQVSCIACHLARPADGDGSDAIAGHAITGHTFTAKAGACTDCHSPDTTRSPLP